MILQIVKLHILHLKVAGLDEEKTEALRRKSFIFMDIKVKKGEEK